MTKKISEILTQYCSKEGINFQITLKSNDKNKPQCCDVPFYGYKWITITKEDLDKLVIDYIEYKLLNKSEE